MCSELSIEDKAKIVDDYLKLMNQIGVMYLRATGAKHNIGPIDVELILREANVLAIPLFRARPKGKF